MRRPAGLILLSLLETVSLPLRPARGEEDPAAQLMGRSYCLADLGGGEFVVGTTYGVQVFRLAPPTEKRATWSTTQVHAHALPDSVNHVLVHREVVYAANGPHGVQGLRVDSGTHALTLLAHLETEGAAMGLAAVGPLLLVAQGVMGVAAVDISAPHSPLVQVNLDTGGYARRLLAATHDPAEPGQSAAGVDVWVANGSGGVAFFHLAPGGAVLSTRSLKTEGDARDIRFMGDGLLFSRGHRGICRVDRSLTPEGMSCVENEDVARSLAVAGTTVYVGDGGNGIMVTDWTSPAQPRLEHRYKPAGGSMNALLLADKLLIAAADYYGILVIPLAELRRSPGEPSRP